MRVVTFDRMLAATFLLGSIGLLAPVKAQAAPESFGYEQLAEIIQTHDVRTVDDLLPLLPEEYRRFYLFVYESRSAQAPNSFPEAPRTILYGKDSTFIMAFTKSPKTAPVVDHPDTVETIQWNKEKRLFEFRELVFGEGKNPLETPPEVNPLKCLACHGKDPRPNWDTYNIWPGSYGSVSRLSCDTMQPGTLELKRYQEFMGGQRKGDRYKHLPAERPASGSGSGLLSGACPDDPAKEVTFRNAVHTDPNAILTEQLTKLNFLRLHRIIKKSPRFPKLLPFLAGRAKGCFGGSTLETFFPEGYAAAQGFLTFDEALKDVINGGKADFAQRLLRFTPHNKGSAYEAIRQPVSFLDPDDKLGGGYGHRHDLAMIRLLADRLKMTMNRWSLPFTDGTYDFVTPTGMPSEFFSAFGEDFGSLAKQECEDLKKASLAQFADGK